MGNMWLIRCSSLHLPRWALLLNEINEIRGISGERGREGERERENERVFVSARVPSRVSIDRKRIANVSRTRISSFKGKAAGLSSETFSFPRSLLSFARGDSLSRAFFRADKFDIAG